MSARVVAIVFEGCVFEGHCELDRIALVRAARVTSS